MSAARGSGPRHAGTARLGCSASPRTSGPPAWAAWAGWASASSRPSGSLADGGRHSAPPALRHRTPSSYRVQMRIGSPDSSASLTAFLPSRTTLACSALAVRLAAEVWFSPMLPARLPSRTSSPAPTASPTSCRSAQQRVTPTGSGIPALHPFASTTPLARTSTSATAGRPPGCCDTELRRQAVAVHHPGGETVPAWPSY
jgi:hypothetical protein